MHSLEGDRQWYAQSARRLRTPANPHEACFAWNRCARSWKPKVDRVKDTLDGCSFASCLHLVKYVIMMRISKAHIAGVGVAEAADASLLEPAIAAGTRALLDAGVTYSDLEQSIACFQDELRIPRQCFDAFGMEGAPCHEMSNSSGLFTAVQCVRSRQSDCVLVIGLDTVSIH